MDRWVGKVAVVTGASSGIGKQTVEDLSAKGIIVVTLDIREDKLKELAASYKEKVYPIKCDVSKEQDVVKAFAWIEKKLGGVDILVNCAGILKEASLIGGEPINWTTMMQTNVLGLSICTREAIKTMRKRGDDGHIIHINSILGHIVPSYTEMSVGMYSACKHAVTALTEALRIELQGLNSNIKVTSISPGMVNTGMLQKFYGNPDQFEMDAPAPKPPVCIEPRDVTEAILYCLGTRPLVQVHQLTVQAIGQKNY